MQQSRHARHPYTCNSYAEKRADIFRLRLSPTLTHHSFHIPTPFTIAVCYIYPLTHRSAMRTLIFKLFFVIPIAVSGILHPHLYGTMPLLYPLKPITLSFLHTLKPTTFSELPLRPYSFLSFPTPLPLRLPTFFTTLTLAVPTFLYHTPEWSYDPPLPP